MSVETRLHCLESMFSSIFLYHEKPQSQGYPPLCRNFQNRMIWTWFEASFWNIFSKMCRNFAWNFENFDVFLKIVKNFLADVGKGKHVQLKICIQWETLEKGLSTQTSEFSKSNDLNLIWGCFCSSDDGLSRLLIWLLTFFDFAFSNILIFSVFNDICEQKSVKNEKIEIFEKAKSKKMSDQISKPDKPSSDEQKHPSN